MVGVLATGVVADMVIDRCESLFSKWTPSA